ncbi:myb family transcription factor EFM-like isoform X2 [Aristolochia californica]|uniref:myb family transcription factor EFM-like isoform X2 n=1 Tax=Aristolochia californica TaxID=171875 RepID=UPI0035E1886E
MGSSSELSLDFKSSFTPKTIAGLLQEVSGIGDRCERSSKLEDYVKCLEEERRKIDAFKRELPLCMFLLSDAIEALKMEAKQCRSANARPVLEEFMPIRSKFEEDGGVKTEKDSRDKMNWMSSAQLWSDNYNEIGNNNNGVNNYKKNKIAEKTEESNRSVIGNPFSESKYKSSGGAFMPFKEFSGFPARPRKEERDVSAVPDLSLLSPGVKSVSTESGGSGASSKSGNKANPSVSSNFQSNIQPLQQPRKARRCWSPELHRRFVNSLQQLGGAQATPKQIRELMKVEGLTNDEVKSHLQKYRLHTRRVPTSASNSSNQSVVLLGGIWVPPDHYQSSKPSTSQSGSPQGPLQLAGNSRGISNTGGDSCEDEEEKSESYSWKGHLTRSGEDETV